MNVYSGEWKKGMQMLQPKKYIGKQEKSNPKYYLSFSNYERIFVNIAVCECLDLCYNGSTFRIHLQAHQKTIYFVHLYTVVF